MLEFFLMVFAGIVVALFTKYLDLVFSNAKNETTEKHEEQKEQKDEEA